ncbi:MAG TPA: DedA family protein [Patescibacteria group bacterium]|nr:DedA family protein [Patescibacteria group bacterium]
MLESAIEFIQQLSPIGILLFACLITFTENIFPPSPSDLLLVFCGTLVGLGTVGFFPLTIMATIGSTIGFAVMYWLGKKFEKNAVEKRKLKFIPEEALFKVEGWFRKWGYWLIIVNRFMSGTRAVISFFAGMSKLNFSITLLLSAVSALLWNGILVFLGMKLGENWRSINEYLTTYGKVIGIVIAIAVIFFTLKWFIQRKSLQND